MAYPRADRPFSFSQRRRPGAPSHGIIGMLAGGATVPGRALIDVLPFVEQTVLKSVLWQVGRALATGAEVPATTAKLSIRTAALPRPIIRPFPFRDSTAPEWSCAARPDIACLIRGKPIQRPGHPDPGVCCSRLPD